MSGELLPGGGSRSWMDTRRLRRRSVKLAAVGRSDRARRRCLVLRLRYQAGFGCGQRGIHRFLRRVWIATVVMAGF